MSTLVDFRPVFDQVIFPFLEAALAPAAVWLGTRVAKFLHLKADSDLANRLEQGLWNALHYGLAKAQVTADGHSSVQVKSEVIAHALNYIVPKMPEIIKRFGLTPQGLRERLESRFAQLTAEQALEKA